VGMRAAPEYCARSHSTFESRGDTSQSTVRRLSALILSEQRRGGTRFWFSCGDSLRQN
jgi:hypothetical protein